LREERRLGLLRGWRISGGIFMRMDLAMRFLGGGAPGSDLFLG
jgi:hypothetical protein